MPTALREAETVREFEAANSGKFEVRRIWTYDECGRRFQILVDPLFSRAVASLELPDSLTLSRGHATRRKPRPACFPVIRLTVGGVILAWQGLKAEKGWLGRRPSVSYWDLFDFEDGLGWNRYGWKEEYNEPALWGGWLGVGSGGGSLVWVCLRLG